MADPEKTGIPILVDLNAEQIQNAVVNAIVASGFGEKLKEGVNKALNEKKHYSDGTIVEQACEAAVRDVVQTIVKTEMAKPENVAKVKQLVLTCPPPTDDHPHPRSLIDKLVSQALFEAEQQIDTPRSRR